MVDLPKLVFTSPEGAETNTDSDPVYRDGIDSFDSHDDEAGLDQLVSLPSTGQLTHYVAPTALFGHSSELDGPLSSGGDYLTAPADPSTIWADGETLTPQDLYQVSFPNRYMPSDYLRRSMESESAMSFDHSSRYDGPMNSSTPHFSPALSGSPPSSSSVGSFSDHGILTHGLPHSSTIEYVSSIPMQMTSLSLALVSYQPDLRLQTEQLGGSPIPISYSPSRWSDYGSPTSLPSSISDSPMAFPSPIGGFRSGYAFHDHILPSSNGSPASPVPSLAADVNVANASLLSPVSDEGSKPTPFLTGGRRMHRPSHVDGRLRRNKYHARRSSSASSGVRFLQEYSPEIASGPPPMSGSSLAFNPHAHGDVGRQRRAFSGPREREMLGGMSSVEMDPRRGRVSDSYIVGAPPPTRDDSGMSLTRMWEIAQDTPTFDEDEYEPSPSPSPAAPASSPALGFPKKQVASEALMNAAIGRRKNEATFFCSVNGCSSSFTTKHNLINHMNSHFRIKEYQCVQCGRDFGTAHVLTRHRNKACKGRKKKTMPSQD